MAPPLIDRRARETYVNSAPSMVLTLLADADTIADLLDRTKLLDEVAEAANAELAGLIEARVEAEEAGQRAAAAERSAADAKAVMRARAAEFERHPSDPCNCNPTLRHDDHVHISVRS